MVRLNSLHTDSSKKGKSNIFDAARNDDPAALSVAIKNGETLNDVEDKGNLMTPMHVACILQSRKFLDAAKNYDFDPWIKDMSDRLAIDHARAHGLKETQTMLLKKMYPGNLADDTIVPLSDPS